jgi:3-phosphoglycerate kinase
MPRLIPSGIGFLFGREITRLSRIRENPDRPFVVIIGGAMYGSSVAWWLSRNLDFAGSILVIERDMSFEFASTSHTNSCIRQQFSNSTNIQISQFGAEFINNFPSFFDYDPRVPNIFLQSFGY